MTGPERTRFRLPLWFGALSLLAVLPNTCVGLLVFAASQGWVHGGRIHVAWHAVAHLMAMSAIAIGGTLAIAGRNAPDQRVRFGAALGVIGAAIAVLPMAYWVWGLIADWRDGYAGQDGFYMLGIPALLVLAVLGTGVGLLTGSYDEQRKAASTQ